MIMINVNGRFPAADCTHSLLSSNHRPDLRGANTVAPHQMVMAISAVEPFFRFLATSVMARLAVGVTTISDVLVARKVFERFLDTTVRTDLGHRGEQLIT